MKSRNEIRKYLTTKMIGKDIHSFDTLDSTNTFAKQLARGDAQNGALIIAEEQTAGRGRMGRKWQSEKGKNLTFSVLLYPAIPSDQFGVLSLMAGVAVTEAIQSLTQITPKCKWPNDIEMNNKKICGILNEAIFRDEKSPAVVIGIGININQTEFSPELTNIATSLSIETGIQFDRLKVLAGILNSLEHWYEILESGRAENVLTTWKTYSSILGRDVTVDQQGTLVNGIATDISNDGGLIIRTGKQSIKVLAGDVMLNN